MNQTIRRKANKTQNYSVIFNEVLRRNDLSARAKGLWAYLMTLPDDWEIHKTELYSHFTEGRDALDKAFKELEEAGYIVHTVVRKCGRFYHEYNVLESTETENQCGKSGPGLPGPEKPDTENPQLLNTNILNTDNQILISNPQPTSLALVEPKKAVDPLYKPTLDYLNQSLARILPDPKYEKADFVAVDWMAKKIIQLSPGNTEGFIDALLATWLDLRRKKEFFGTQPLTPLALRKSHTWGTVIAEMSKTIQRSRQRAEV